MSLETFYKTFDCGDYSVQLSHNSIQFNKGDKAWFISGDWRNSIDQLTGGVTISNYYMRFDYYPPVNIKGMFDFIAKGFDVKIF